MSVPVNQRTEGKLDVCTKAYDLCCYTLHITSNSKIFDERYRLQLTDRIESAAIEIYEKIYCANDIYVNTEDDYYQRKQLQIEAIRACNHLLILIDVAKKIFHLKSSRVFYWAGKVIEVKNMTRKWKDSDADRYKKKLNK